MGVDYFETPIGLFCVKANEIGITNLTRVETLQHGTPTIITTACANQVQEYFQKKRTIFELPLDYSGSSFFNQSVWNVIKKIPFGRTRSYLSIAKN